MLTLELNQETVVTQPHPEYLVQHAIVDLDHLELVALEKVAKSSFIPHFHLIAPSSL